MRRKSWLEPPQAGDGHQSHGAWLDHLGSRWRSEKNSRAGGGSQDGGEVAG